MPEPRRAAVAAATAPPGRIAFLGFGLIGSSIARALRDPPPPTAGTPPGSWSRVPLVAWTPSRTGPARGLGAGLLDAVPASVAVAVRDADLIVLAAPPLAILALLRDQAAVLRTAAERGATVTDVASTKAEIVDLAAGLGLPFVGGHPMAGRDASGVDAGAADLFAGRPWVLVPASTAREADVQRVTALARAVGAMPVRLTGAEHDQAVAGISHLPLAVAAALVESVAVSQAGAADWEAARALAAGGWTDMTRLARGEPEMGAGIFATNAPAVATRLRALRGVLDAWLAEIEALEDAPAADRPLLAGRLRDRLAGARAALSPPAAATEEKARPEPHPPGEQVLVIPRASIMGDPGWRGIREEGLAGFEDLVARVGTFRPRAEMERDRAWKQVIPYLVLRDGRDYFLMQRTRAGGDARLHDRWSIGIGGHVNPGDGGLLGGLRREWAEEIDADFEPEFRLVGLLNDDTTEVTDVGTVHLGAVYLADAAGRRVAIRETDKLAGEFAAPEAVAAVVDRLESWSALVFQHLEMRAVRRG
jgi:prephenate dehydrogenase